MNYLIYLSGVWSGVCLGIVILALFIGGSDGK